MKSDKIKLGRWKDLALLFRDECTIFGSNNEADLTTEYLYSIDLEKGITMNTSSGPIMIEKVRKTDDDIQVALAYNDFRRGLKRAYLSLGQEIKIRKVREDSNPDKYVVSHCSFMITTKEYADRKVEEFYEVKDKSCKVNTK